MHKTLTMFFIVIISFVFGSCCESRSSEGRENLINRKATAEANSYKEDYNNFGFDKERLIKYFKARQLSYGKDQMIDRNIINPNTCYILYIHTARKCVLFCKPYRDDQGPMMSTLDSCEEVEEEILNIHAFKDNQ